MLGRAVASGVGDAAGAKLICGSKDVCTVACGTGTGSTTGEDEAAAG